MTRIFGYLLEKAILAVGAIGATWWIWRRGGTEARKDERRRQEAERMKQLAEELHQRYETSQKLKEKRDEVDALTDDSVSQRLRDKWTRPEDR